MGWICLSGQSTAGITINELMFRPDVPARVSITEYVDVAHAFFEAEEPRVVNGVLDALARAHRPAEF